MHDSKLTSESDSAKEDGEISSSLPQEVVDRNFKRWWTAMELSHEFMMAGLRERHGSEEAARKAYREFQIKHRAEKLAAYKRAAERYYAAKAERSKEQDDATDRSDDDA